MRDAWSDRSPVSPTLVGPAVVAGLFVAAAALAGARLGALAVLLALPAAVAAAGLKRHVEMRQEGLKLLSQQDALTGLGNRRLLQERLAYEVSRHRRHGRRFVLMALDLDGFKQVNDRFGHQAGDEVLREVARALERAVREQDTVVRMGGDEFCILVPESSWEDAEHMTDRLRRSVSGSVGGLDSLSVSVGFAVFPDEGWAPEHLLARADQASIESKRRARAARGLRAA
jgi:diguanylate cyclase (GGDEF)-like protein